MFNNAAFIRESVESVLSQTFRDIELIIVDDGSTDGTREQLTPLMQSIRYFRTENGGPARARNLGIREARGQLIAFQDADDRWLPAKLERQVGHLAEHPEHGVVFSDVATFDDSGVLESSAGESYGCLPSGAIFADLLTKRFIAMSSVVVRRECLDRTGYFDESLRGCEDYNLFLRLAGRFTFGLVDEVLVHKRIHPANLSNNLQQMLQDEITNIEKIAALFPEKPICKRRLIAGAYLKFGKHLFANGDDEAARRCMWRAALRVFFTGRDWLFLLLLMLPKAMRHAILSVRRSRESNRPASAAIGPLH